MELAVGGGLQARLLLHPDGGADRLVLDGTEIAGGDSPCLVLGARLQQLSGP